MDLQEICKKINVNYEETIERFGGNELIYTKFLKRFLEDNTYCNLKESWEKNDYEGIEKNAHTLKGVAGNLGLEELFNISDRLVQAMRKKEYEKTERFI